MRPVAYMVVFRASNNLDAVCESLFTERWLAEAFAEGCAERMQARVVPLCVCTDDPDVRERS